jgi:hypothetical protein
MHLILVNIKIITLFSFFSFFLIYDFGKKNSNFRKICQVYFLNRKFPKISKFFVLKGGEIRPKKNFEWVIYLLVQITFGKQI